MSDLQDLYQEVVIDHSRSPQNFRRIDDADLAAVGHNPLCGDRVEVFLRFDGDRVADISFQGSGCAISTASASLLTGALQGKTRDEVRQIYGDFLEMVTGDPTLPATGEHLGKLVVLAGVREFASRVKCATLVWHTLQRALDGNTDYPVSTE